MKHLAHGFGLGILLSLAAIGSLTLAVLIVGW